MAKHPQVQQLLQIELDTCVPLDSSNIIANFDQVKGLPYLNACIKEALRLFATVGSGLPRVVPPGKTFSFGGETFKEGSVISVPAYTTNRSTLLGSDAEEFRPERWLEDETGEINKYNVPFSMGSR
jgi:benzoate 4-monooxygenase